MYSGTYNTGDTITSEATPSGRGGISVIRISGIEAVNIVTRILDRELPDPGHHLFGKLFNSKNIKEYIDDVVVNYFKQPHSYTGEDVIEISTHGSPLIVTEVLDQLYANGARPALPGEFTFRAFINGKIDLNQAEAVADLIQASSIEGLSIARRQLRGEIGAAADRISDAIFQLLKNCEIELDFSEEDVVVMDKAQKMNGMVNTIDDIDRLLSGYEKSRRIREGVRVTITGKPNVGKSSLFNALLDEERAIVHEKPGTTRDVIIGTMHFKGVAFELYDTAGIREAGDEIEDEGIKRALKAADQADYVLAVQDNTTLTDDVSYLINNTLALNILNKIDIYNGNYPQGFILVSATRRDGIGNLKEKLYEKAVGSDIETTSIISRERQYNALFKTRQSIEGALNATKDNQTGEIIAEELREALEAIEELAGKKKSSDIIHSIFSEFCVGK